MISCSFESGFPVFYVVTPAFNSVDTIDVTIQNVISQKGDFSICYHIQDGASTDGTINRLEHWHAKLSEQNSLVQCRNVKFTWNSAVDKGMYDAIIKGFNDFLISPDDFMTWINADDVLLPGVLAMICNLSHEYSEIQWIGGPQYVIENDVLILTRDVPIPTAVIREGLCDGYHWHFLQQEGSFFKKRLWVKGRHALQGFRLAGDWSLWREFARHAKYFQCEKPMGAFRRREGQLSITYFDDYMQEIDRTLQLKKRTEAFVNLQKMKNLHRHLIKLDNPSGNAMIEKEQLSVRKEFDERWKKI